jgi:hypothetical protein
MVYRRNLATMRESAVSCSDADGLLQVTAKERRNKHVNDANEEFEHT